MEAVSSNVSQNWIWKKVKDDICSDLFGLYLSYLLPSKNDVKESFEKVLISIRQLEFCNCGKIHSSIYKKNLFVRGFTVCGRIAKPLDSFGFFTPVTISSKLRKLCEINGPLPEVISGVDINKLVYRYVRNNCLFDENDKSYFTLDEKMATVFGIKGPINFFQLRSCVRAHLTRSHVPFEICYIYRMFKV